jgi:hypothetical protein
MSPAARARLAVLLRELAAVLEEVAPEDRETKPARRRRAAPLPLPPSGPVDPLAADRARRILRGRGIPPA